MNKPANGGSLHTLWLNNILSKSHLPKQEWGMQYKIGVYLQTIY